MTKEQQQLIAAYLDGEEVSETLMAECRNDPEVLKALAELTAVERLLWLAALDENGAVFASEVRERLSSKGEVDFSQAVGARLLSSKRKRLAWLMSLAAAACVVFAFVLFQGLRSAPELGRLTAARDAVWEDSAPFKEDHLTAGSMSLLEGYSEITMVNGVTLLLEAPVEIDVVSEDLIHLREGRLVARVPQQAIGFTVITPTSEVVDLGTEFGMSVASNGLSEVHVLDGEVKARPLNQKAFSNLLKDEGMVIDENQQTSLIQSNPERFRRALPGRSAVQPQYLHWSFDAGSQQAECGGTGIEGKFYPGELKAFNDGSGPEYQNGQFGEALYFNGVDAYVKTEFPGIGGKSPRTIAFWTKVPKDFSIRNGYGMLGWGLMQSRSAWQISPNPTEREGPLGRLRVGTMDAPVVGTTDLRDNRWHHVAIVMYGGDEADVSTHVLLYVDGRLEKTSIKSVAQIETEVGHQKSRPLMFGRNMAFKTDSSLIPDRFFKGWIDEVFVFDTALEQEKIQRLMQANRLD
ncbi:MULTISPECIES: LamG-like jellyroll fold domain-containing protein [unclassified Lentimonas]|uniref:LamG-like jellyroll fold domain-containing protein n=1 Tax=unclassified Lentimonas TaxID=2630993 RepID=UPI00132175DE|nr:MULTISPECIES: LamG-like jellyroll fold domain-containing protein [unclassified Lentimonas]CAA6677649.1 Unannotated [Lentimonas sp. CC4]CAA6684912.1 Unannotated [Lentimonas sp. CC6]CAA7077975.1 Unannotated [Lentimonas sp. CC4]CAA7169896.1 Unannotated [Lentimonas sp. CC21]CAA7181448.1 Unannotated [Lentimonas sp. CC8]